MNSPLLAYPVNADAAHPPPQHWVTPFNDDGFRNRQELRKISAQYDRDWRQPGGTPANTHGSTS